MAEKDYGPMFYGPVPPVGARIRHFHPWLGHDGAVGTVTRIEQILPPGPPLVGEISKYGRYHVHLTDVMYWNSDLEWGPAPDTYMDTLGESWSYEPDAQPGLETVLPSGDPTSGPGEGA